MNRNGLTKRIVGSGQDQSEPDQKQRILYIVMYSWRSFQESGVFFLLLLLTDLLYIPPPPLPPSTRNGEIFLKGTYISPPKNF